jgi:hypothetical protein
MHGFQMYSCHGTCLPACLAVAFVSLPPTPLFFNFFLAQLCSGIATIDPHILQERTVIEEDKRPSSQSCPKAFKAV